MHLLTILAFACLFWRAEDSGEWVMVAADDVYWTLIASIGYPLVVAAMSSVVSRHGLRLLHARCDDPDIVYRFHHRATIALRFSAAACFAAIVFLTRWYDFFTFGDVTPALQIVGDFIVLLPYFAAVILMWLFTFPFEKALRSHAPADADDDEKESESAWRLSSYLDFHLRHYLLVVAVPMAVILFAANISRGYESALQGYFGVVWAPDIVLGVVSACVFIVAPVMLRHIWRTHPLPAGPLRDELETICRRIGLRCRDILIWKSDGLMINAAVMGLFAPVRYVLLSDALLKVMSAKQVEAVFGHEAGHIRRRHIEHFLVFAFVGWLLAASTMELLARLAMAWGTEVATAATVVQGAGVAVTVLFWGVGFGMLSRRFERQADLFGARCVTPENGDCLVPCSVHIDGSTTSPNVDRVCATGASLFASALDKVALLNGIPLEERSWRHSSIGSRIRFLNTLAGDPGCAERFERMLRRVKLLIVSLAVIGCCAGWFYWESVREPAILQIQTGL